MGIISVFSRRDRLTLQLLNRIVTVHSHEVAPLLLSTVSMACVLASYFLVAPLCEDAGISLGTAQLPRLFLASLLGTLLVTPAVTTFLNRSGVPRAVSLRRLYVFVGCILFGFYLFYQFSSGVHLVAAPPPTPASATMMLFAAGPLPTTTTPSSQGAGSRLGSNRDVKWLHDTAVTLPRQQQQPLAWREFVQSTPHHLAAIRPGQDAVVLLSREPGHKGQGNGDDDGDRDGGTVAVASGRALASESRRRQPVTVKMEMGAAAEVGMESVRHEWEEDNLDNALGEGAEVLPPSVDGTAALLVLADAEAEGEGVTPARVEGGRGSSNSGSPSSSTGSRPGSDQVRSGRSASGSQATSQGQPGLSPWTRGLHATFYVFVHVQNLVVMSAMWARCADVFTPEPATRLFGVVAAGATTGQLIGSLVTVSLTTYQAGIRSSTAAAGSVDPALPAHQLILLSGVLLFSAAYIQGKIRKPQAGLESLPNYALAASGPAAVNIAANSSGEISSPAAAPSGGGLGLMRRQTKASTGLPDSAAGSGAGSSAGIDKALGSMRLVLASPYLSAIAGYLMLTYVVGSLMYFQRAQVVAMSLGGTRRAAFFAQLQSLSASVILLLQLFATGRLLQAVPMSVVLAGFPVFCGAGAVLIGMTGSANAVALVEVGRKVLGYSLIRPAREVLFTVVSKEEKWRAKVAMDTVVQRLGDTVAAGIFEILSMHPSIGPLGVVAAACLVSIAWIGAGVVVGTRYLDRTAPLVALPLLPAVDVADNSSSGLMAGPQASADAGLVQDGYGSDTDRLGQRRVLPGGRGIAALERRTFN